MNDKRKALFVLGAAAVLALAVWFGGGALWRLLLAMHGIH